MKCVPVSSHWFYAPENVGVKIKSPIELIAGIMRTLQVTFDDAFSLFFIEKALGQVLFSPPNVAGWPGGKKWIDNSTLMLRLNLVGYLFQAVDVNFKIKEDFESKERNKAVKKINAKVDLNPLVDLFKNDSQQDSFEKMTGYFLQADSKIDLSDFNSFIIRNNQEDFIKTVVLRLMSMPEYQMC